MGLVALIPLLGILGGILVAADVGTTTAWILLGVGVVWLVATIVWAQQVPGAQAGEGASRMFSPRSDRPPSGPRS